VEALKQAVLEFRDEIYKKKAQKEDAKNLDHSTDMLV
jgi:hypothetical protein